MIKSLSLSLLGIFKHKGSAAPSLYISDLFNSGMFHSLVGSLHERNHRPKQRGPESA